jgi:hypothetical protein
MLWEHLIKVIPEAYSTHCIRFLRLYFEFNVCIKTCLHVNTHRRWPTTDHAPILITMTPVIKVLNSLCSVPPVFCGRSHVLFMLLCCFRIMASNTISLYKLQGVCIKSRNWFTLHGHLRHFRYIGGVGAAHPFRFPLRQCSTNSWWWQ